MATSTLRWRIQMEISSHRDREAERVLRLRSNTSTNTPRYIYRESALSIYIAWGAKIRNFWTFLLDPGFRGCSGEKNSGCPGIPGILRNVQEFTNFGRFLKKTGVPAFPGSTMGNRPIPGKKCPGTKKVLRRQKKCSGTKKVLRNKKKWFRTTFLLFRHLDTRITGNREKSGFLAWKTDFLKIRGRSWMDVPEHPGSKSHGLLTNPGWLHDMSCRYSPPGMVDPPSPGGVGGVSWVFGGQKPPQKGGTLGF